MASLLDRDASENNSGTAPKKAAKDNNQRDLKSRSNNRTHRYSSIHA
jgi:hypothetical protein